MKRFWSWLAVWCGKHAGLVAVIGLLITLTMGVGATRLKFATSQSSYLNKTDQVYKDDVRYEKLFGGQAMVVMISMNPGHTIDQFFTPANTKKLNSLEAELRAGAQAHGLQNTIGPIDVLDFSNSLVSDSYANGKLTPTADITKSIAGTALLRGLQVDPTAVGRAARTKDSGVTLTRVAAVKGAHNLTNPEWIKFLLYNNDKKIRLALHTFYPNATHSQIIVRLDGNQTLDQQSASADYVVKTASKYTFDNATIVTTGAPSLLENINQYLKGGMFLLGGIAVVVMIIILLVLFDVRWRLLPMGVILVGLVWAFGLAGYLGIPLTLATIAGLPVMLGVGIDYAIQMQARVEEEVVDNHAEHPIQETATNLCPALLVVTFDAIFAFSALYFAKVPMIRQFGALLAVGIAAICLCSILLPLASLGIREYKSPTRRQRSKRSEKLGNIVVKLGDLPKASAVPLVVASLVIFFGGILVEGKLKLQTDPIQWVNQDSQVIKNIHALEKGTGSANELGVFVQGKDVFNNGSVAYVDDFTTQQLRDNHDKLATANSVVANISDLVNDVQGSNHINPLGSDITAAYAAATPDLRKSFANPQHTALNIIFRTGAPDGTGVPLSGQADLVKSMKVALADSKQHGLITTPSGLAVVGVGLLQNLEANRVLLTYLSIAFVAAFLALRLRSLVRSLLSLVPVLIAVGAASLVEYALDLKLSPLTAVGGPLVVAVCTEFTSLILLRFVEERGKGHSPRDAVEMTASRTGRAFIVSGLTAISGVAVIATSSMPLLRDFGIVVGMNVTVALLSALVFLPPMLVWADDDGRNWVSRHLVPDDVLDGGGSGAAATPAHEPEPVAAT